MNKKYGVVRTLISALVFFLVFAIVGGYSFAEEKAVTSSNGIPKWRKVAVLPPDADRGGSDMTWCGKSAIVYSYSIPLPAMGQEEAKGPSKKGIELYDLKTGKWRQIVETEAGSPFCNADGSVVFWRTMVIDKGKKIEELHLSNMYTTWEFDLKTGSKRRISVHSIISKKAIEHRRHGYYVPYILFPYLKQSLTNDIFIIGDEENQLAELSKRLPDWRIIRMPFDPYTCDIGNWARDGGYFYFMTTDPKTGICRTAIYDVNGRLKLYPDPPFENEYHTVIIKGVYYVLDTKANLLIRTDIETGEKRTYPMPEGTKGFDISPKGEMVYWKGGEGYGSGPNIYFSNKIGDKQYLLEYRGSSPMFSPDGEYLYFDPGYNMKTIVLKRE